MSDESRLTLPFRWAPRPYQQPVWDYLAAGGKRAVLRWGRRHGKDDVLLHHTVCAAHERTGDYWYCAPSYSQARKAFWEATDPHQGKRRLELAFPPEVIRRERSQEMTLDLHCGSTFRVVGSDNFDSLVGSPPVGIVFSEYALANPAAWGYLRPILLENGGWAAFNSTPRGKNHFKRLCDSAEASMRTLPDGSVDPEGWFYSTVTVDDSGLFTDAQMRAELREMQDEHGEEYGRSLWLQEYWVSFDAAIPGSILGDKVAIARESGRIGRVPHEPGVPVHTGWDLGRTDATVVWFYQVFAGEVRVLDHHASNFKDIPFYAEMLREKRRTNGWVYGTQWLPHDARPRTLAAGGKSILQQFHDLNEAMNGELGRFAIAKRLDKQEQIQAGRATLSKAWIDEERCQEGVEALAHYHRVWDPEKRVFMDAPEHDWSSHHADAWFTVAVSWRSAREASQDTSEGPSQARLLGGSLPAQSFGYLKARHLKAMRRKRASGLIE